ncbi:transposase [Solitalea longa]|uniref:Transposase n=2 Tax=Solitalea longa TaxID=2079460 RepID=A0A2S4ZXK4_9SPHI|nr:transposase [Solitalea longa]
MGLKNRIHKGYLYFLTITVVDWVDIFSRPVYKHIIIDSLKHCQKQKGLEIYAWCLMTNHLHLIVSVSPDNFYSLSDILRDFKKFTSKAIVEMIEKENESRKDWILNRFEFAGKYDPKIKCYKFWQEGNEAKEIHSNEFLEQKIEYVHQNPVVAEIVNEPEHYKFSSAVDYAGGKGLLEVILED